MMFLLTCDKKLTKSQLSPTHASTKRKITDELKHNAGGYEVREGSPVEVQWAKYIYSFSQSQLLRLWFTIYYQLLTLYSPWISRSQVDIKLGVFMYSVYVDRSYIIKTVGIYLFLSCFLPLNITANRANTLHTINTVH